MAAIALSDRLANIINELEQGATLEAKLAQLAEYEIRRRLARYQLTDRMFHEKYGVSLEEFEANEVVKKLNYTFDVENDHQDWDLAADGIRSMERRLADLQAAR